MWDLGIVIDCNLKFDEHIGVVVHKAQIDANVNLKYFISCNRKLLRRFIPMLDLFLNTAL